jgi:hypothetical protein
LGSYCSGFEPLLGVGDDVLQNFSDEVLEQSVK